MARNRKRATERQRCRAGAAAARRSATARSPELEDDIPASIRHAAPDVELAEAQLALGRPDLADADPELADAEPTFAEAEDPESLDEEQFEELEDEVDEAKPRAGRSRRDGAESDGAGAVATTGAHAPAHRPNIFTRLVHFLQGSWRELQRVQWPDRRQVIQATSVVIGFVIVAGAFLGIADLLATKLMKFILG
ncbi:MAG: preprotein translocase subunit SecE [Solirubrobacterales bacterium]